MSSCDAVRVELKAYLDGELSALARAGVRRHLEHCARCRAEAAAMEQIGRELRTLDTATPRPELRARILAQLPESPAPAERKQPGLLWRRPGAAALAFAGAAAMLVLFAVILKNRPTTVPTTLSEIETLETPTPATEEAPPTAFAARGNSPTADSPRTRIASGPTPPVKKDGGKRRTILSSGRIAPRRESSSTVRPGAQRPSPLPSRPLEAKPASSPPGLAGPAPSAAQPALKDQTELKKEMQADSLLGKSVTDEAAAPAGGVGGAPAEETAREAVRLRGLQFETNAPTVQAEQTMVLFVDSVETRRAEVEKVARQAGGYVGAYRLDTERDGVKSASVTVLVPQEQVASFKSQLHRYHLSANTANSSNAYVRGGVAQKRDDQATRMMRRAAEPLPQQQEKADSKAGVRGKQRAQNRPLQQNPQDGAPPSPAEQTGPAEPGRPALSTAAKGRSEQFGGPGGGLGGGGFGGEHGVGANTTQPLDKTAGKDRDIHGLDPQQKNALTKITLQLRETPKPAQRRPQKRK